MSTGRIRLPKPHTPEPNEKYQTWPSVSGADLDILITASNATLWKLKQATK